MTDNQRVPSGSIEAIDCRGRHLQKLERRMCSSLGVSHARVSWVEYKLDDAVPEWNNITTDADKTGYKCYW